MGPGPQSIRGFMIVDDLAKLGANNIMTNPEPIVGICKSLVIQGLARWVTDQLLKK